MTLNPEITLWMETLNTQEVVELGCLMKSVVEFTHLIHLSSRRRATPTRLVHGGFSLVSREHISLNPLVSGNNS